MYRISQSFSSILYMLFAYHLFTHSQHDCCTHSLLIQHRSPLTYHKYDILLVNFIVTTPDLVKKQTILSKLSGKHLKLLTEVINKALLIDRSRVEILTLLESAQVTSSAGIRNLYILFPILKMGSAMLQNFANSPQN